MYILKFNDEIIFKTKSYARLYRKLLKIGEGGLMFGMDIRTLNILGYKIDYINA